MTRSGVSRILATACAAALAAAGLAACSLPAGSVAPPSLPSTTRGAGSSAPVKPDPASLAGGACLLLDYATINKTLGTNFDVAASADKSDSYTCVVQSSSASFPDLTLSITATDLSVSDFQSDVAPSKSKKVSSLGKVGYEIEHAASGENGPTIEVGWLSGNERLIVMTYAYAPDAQADPALVGKMDELARAVDGATV
jgi:hypothetical protein